MPPVCDGVRIHLLSIPSPALSCLSSLLFTSIAEDCPHDHLNGPHEQLSVGDELPVAVVPLDPSYRTPTVFLAHLTPVPISELASAELHTPRISCLFLHTVVMIYTRSHEFTNFPLYISSCKT